MIRIGLPGSSLFRAGRTVTAGGRILFGRPNALRGVSIGGRILFGDTADGRPPGFGVFLGLVRAGGGGASLAQA